MESAPGVKIEPNVRHLRRNHDRKNKRKFFFFYRKGFLPYKRPRHEHKQNDKSRIEDFSFLLFAVLFLLMLLNLRQRSF